MSGSVKLAEPTPEKNPYIGPRAFREGEVLYARDEETHELADLLIAQRIVLLHAPSGAGKTSLIQAGLFPLLRKEKFAPTVPLRVNAPKPHSGVRNRYVNSIAYYLLGSDYRPEKLISLRLHGLLKDVAAREPDRTLLLVLDQFEEILLLDPTDTPNQQAFFEELGEALIESEAWALLSIREDYIGGLDRFVRYIPGHLAATYRLDYLNHEAAMEAIQRPAQDFGVKFVDGAATELVRRLAGTKIQGPGKGEVPVESPYVQPFQLQVVCNALWRSVSKEKQGDFRNIKLNDVKKHADVAGALQSYYAEVVQWVAETTGADERTIRRWFEAELITPQHFRRQTLTGPVSGNADPRKILYELERTYLIRSDTRVNSAWYELSHDQLIGPILKDNENWERPLLSFWQRLARLWEHDPDETLLLDGALLRAAQRQAASAELTPAEVSFLDASVRAERARGVIKHMQTKLSLVYGIVVLEALVIVLLILLR